MNEYPIRMCGLGDLAGGASTIKMDAAEEGAMQAALRASTTPRKTLPRSSPPSDMVMVSREGLQAVRDLIHSEECEWKLGEALQWIDRALATAPASTPISKVYDAIRAGALDSKWDYPGSHLDRDGGGNG